MAYVFHGNFVSPTTSPGCREVEFLQDWLIAIDEEGLIVHSESATTEASLHLLQSASDGASLLESESLGWFLPSFVDTHIHAPQYLNAGTALDKPLMEWLVHYTFSSESRIDKDPNGLGRRVYRRLVERLIEEGTTACSVFGTLEVEANMVLAKAFMDGGIRGQIGKVAMDLNGIESYIETTSSSLSRTEEFISLMRTMTSSLPPNRKLVEPVITPRFVPTCSSELLTGLGAIAKKQGVRIQSHMCEAEDQVEWSKAMWKGKSDVQVLDEAGLLTPTSLMAHCTHASPSDLKLLNSRGTSVAHCPLSNIYFSAEQAFPLREAWNVGVKVGIGSDISGGYTLGLGEGMRWAVAVSRVRGGAAKGEGRAITWRESVWLATRGGAEALGLNCGGFTVGMSFDAQLIKLGSKGSKVDLFDKIEFGEEVVEKWWCCGSVADRQGVWCAGKRLK